MAKRRPRPPKQRGAPANKGERYAQRVLTDDEVQAMLDACSRRSATGVRARALLSLGYRSGLRVQECLRLRPADVDFARKLVTVLWAKGGSTRRRVAGVGPDALRDIEAWLQVRRTLGVGPRALLFCGIKGAARGKPLPTSYVRALLPRLAKRAKIKNRVSFHMLRHTVASQLANRGVPLHRISQQLGHRRLTTTAAYIEKVAPDALGAMMEEHVNAMNGGKENGKK
jgi:integrase/recombinase XerD